MLFRYIIYQLIPGTGNWLANFYTSALNLFTYYLLDYRVVLKSDSFVPLVFFFVSFAILIARSTNYATCSKSLVSSPLVVKAGLPNLSPCGVKALLSPGTVFLFTNKRDKLHTASTLAPSIYYFLKSIRRRWLSVPPETNS